jgi:hypothetical protein
VCKCDPMRAHTCRCSRSGRGVQAPDQFWLPRFKVAVVLPDVVRKPRHTYSRLPLSLQSSLIRTWCARAPLYHVDFMNVFDAFCRISQRNHTYCVSARLSRFSMDIQRLANRVGRSSELM